MKIVAQIIVSIHRTDESRSMLDEIVSVDVGDNPRFESLEVDHAIEKAHRIVMDRMDPVATDKAN